MALSEPALYTLSVSRGRGFAKQQRVLGFADLAFETYVGLRWDVFVCREVGFYTHAVRIKDNV
jgi:hypothetical protein